MTESLQTEKEATPLQFGEDADRLHLEDPEVRSTFNEALMEFCREVEWAPGAIAYVQEHLYERKSPNTNHSLVGVSIPMRALDFAAGNRVYTKTPRLLLKVPDKRRVEAFQGPIVHREKGTPNSALRGWGGAPLNERAVLIYPNKEGNQFNANDRPVVHWSGVCPGDIAIIGRIGIGNENEETITGLISSVIGNPPAGKSIWQHYEDTATVEDLSDILIKLRETGFSNQYHTDETYLVSTEHVSQGNASASGLFRRDKDKETCSAIFLRGDIRLGYRTQEELNLCGFAMRAILYSAQANGSEYRPVSEAFAREHYRYELNDAPVTADKPQTLFKDDQDLRTHEKAFDRLLDRFLEINQAIQRKYGREETPDPENVALQSGMRGTAPQQEHGLG